MYSGPNQLQGNSVLKKKKKRREWEWTALKLIKSIFITQNNLGKWWERGGKIAFLYSLVTV